MLHFRRSRLSFRTGRRRIFEGTNPPTGWFDFVAATPTAGAYFCMNAGGAFRPVANPQGVAGDTDVYFAHGASTTGPLAVQATLPAGASYVNAHLFAYDAAACAPGDAPLACGTVNRVVFPASAGASYVLRVAHPGSLHPSFGLRVGPAMQVLSAPTSGINEEEGLSIGVNPHPSLCGGSYWGATAC